MSQPASFEDLEPTALPNPNHYQPNAFHPPTPILSITDFEDLPPPSFPTSVPHHYPAQASPSTNYPSSTAFVPSSRQRTQNGEHNCAECGKVKTRPCDMRKHVKRHTRPYGCTLRGCGKRFGSRNDWRRHECRQHLYVGTARGERMKQRGQRGGNVPVSAAGRFEREGGFWCGFCRITVGLAGWDSGVEQRLKHVGDHYDLGLQIEKWVSSEEEMAEEREEEAERRGRLLIEVGVGEGEEKVETGKNTSSLNVEGVDDDSSDDSDNSDNDDDDDDDRYDGYDSAFDEILRECEVLRR